MSLSGVSEVNQVITIPYKPRKWALDNLHNVNRKRIVLVCHRRAGKTIAVINEWIKEALTLPNSRWAYIAPTYTQAKDVAWDALKFYTANIPGLKVNETELRVDFPNGARIKLYGSDKPDALRGITLDGAIFDEYSQQPSSIYGEIIRPALMDRQGRAIWIGTPKGKNSFYFLYDKARKDPAYAHAFLLKASKSGVLDQKELDDARNEMTDEQWKQEMECSFDAAIRGSYYSKEIDVMVQSGRVLPKIYDPLLPVYTAWDIGLDDPTAIIFFQIYRMEIRVIDFYTNNNEDMAHYCNVLKSKEYFYDTHFLPWDAEVKNVVNKISPKMELQNNGLRPRVVPSIPIKDGINNVKKTFQLIYLDEALTIEHDEEKEEWRRLSLLDLLRAYKGRYDSSKGIYMDAPAKGDANHASDAFRYLCLAVTHFNLLKRSLRNNNGGLAYLEKNGAW